MAKTIDDVLKEIGVPQEMTDEQVQRIVQVGELGKNYHLFKGGTSKKIIFSYKGLVYVKEDREGAKYILLSGDAY